MPRKIRLDYLYQELPVCWRDEHGREVVFDPRDVDSSKMRDRLLAYGIHHLLRDRTSSVSDPQEKMRQAEEIWKEICAGKWTMRSAASGVRRVSLLARAIARIQGIEPEEAAKKLAGMDKTTLASIRRIPEVEKAIAAIKAEDSGKRQPEITLADLGL